MNMGLKKICLVTTCVIFFSSSCSLMDISVEPKRSKNYKIGALSKHWTVLLDAEADYSFWSQKNVATISVNSLCEKYESASLNILSDNLLRGIDDVKIIK